MLNAWFLKININCNRLYKGKELGDCGGGITRGEPGTGERNLSKRMLSQQLVHP